MAESYDEDLGRHPITSTQKPSRPAPGSPEDYVTYRGAIAPYTEYASGRGKFDLMSGLPGAAYDTGVGIGKVSRFLYDIYRGMYSDPSNPAMLRRDMPLGENIVNLGMQLAPFAGRTRSLPALRLGPPSDARLLQKGAEGIEQAGRLRAPEYPLGYEGPGALGPVADTARDATLKTIKPNKSPEVYATHQQFRNASGAEPRVVISPGAEVKEAFVENMQDPLLNRLTGKIYRDAAAAGEPLPVGVSIESGTPGTMNFGQLVRKRQQLSALPERGAPETVSAIDQMLLHGRPESAASGPSVFGNALGNIKAAEASQAAAQLPGPPGWFARGLTNIGEGLTGGGSRGAGIGGGLGSAIGGSVGLLFGHPEIGASLGGMAGSAAGLPSIGKNLGNIVKQFAGKPGPQGPMGPDAIAAREFSPLNAEIMGSRPYGTSRPPVFERGPAYGADVVPGPTWSSVPQSFIPGRTSGIDAAGELVGGPRRAITKALMTQTESQMLPQGTPVDDSEPTQPSTYDRLRELATYQRPPDQRAPLRLDVTRYYDPATDL